MNNKMTEQRIEQITIEVIKHHCTELEYVIIKLLEKIVEKGVDYEVMKIINFEDKIIIELPVASAWDNRNRLIEAIKKAMEECEATYTIKEK